MIKQKCVRISLYDSGELHTSTSILARLISVGYFNVELINDQYKLLDIYDYHKDNIPQIIIVDAAFINKKYNGFNALDDIKAQFKDIIIICLNDKESLLDTLRSNCDSFIDKSSHNYLTKLESIVGHWAQYVIERESLNKLYTSILG